MSESSLPGDIVREYSAVASSPAARSIRLLAPQLAANADRVADVGCGYMQGTLELLQHHDRVYAIDTEFQRSRIAERLAEAGSQSGFAGFRTAEWFATSRLRLAGAYIVNVLHTLPSVDERVGVLTAARRNLRRSGFVVVDVPCYEHYYSSRMTEENRFSDGYIFKKYPGRFTFYRFTTVQEMDAWAAAAGLAFDFRVTDNHHYVRVYRPQPDLG